MLKKKQQAQQAAQQVQQTEATTNKARRSSLIGSKLTARILLLVLFIMLFSSLSFAWFSGIHIPFNDATHDGLDLSTLSSLKNNVDVIGYSFNEDYDPSDENSNYLTDVTFKTTDEMEVSDSGSKNLFAGDYFEPGAINKLNRSNYATLDDYNAAINAVIDANTNTKYIKVTNRSDMDIAVKTLFTIADVNTSVDDLSGFWYLITDITNDVNGITGIDLIDKLSTYAANNKASRNNSFNELNLSANVFEKLTSKVGLGNIDEPVDKTTGNTKIYRLDYGLCESALRSSGSYYFGRKVQMNVFVYYGQTNAPDGEDTPVQTTIRQVNSEESLISTLNNLKEAFNGDTIQFTADITINGPLTITRPFNFDLNGHSLTINGGDLTFSYNSSTPVTIDCRRTSSIHIIGKRSTTGTTGYDGSLVINTPNSAITFIGDNAKESGIDNYDLRLDGVGSIINYSKNGTGGLYYNSMYTLQYTYDERNNYALVPTETKITLQEGASVNVGEFVDIDMITSAEITSCYISNYGNVGYIYLPSVNIPTYNKLYLYIYNNGKIGDYTGSTPKTWDVQLPSMARPATTQVIKDKKSNNFTIGGSTAFKDSDITDKTDPNLSIVPISNEDNAYTVYITPTTDKKDNSVLKYLFYDYFNNNEENLAGIKKLVIVGTKGSAIDQYDIAFLMKKNAANTDYVFTYLEYLDLSGISVNTTNYGTVGERNNRIPDYAFRNKASLTTVILPEDIVYVGAYAFSGTSISKITIPSNVQKLGSGAFAGVTDVTINSFYPVANSNFLVAFPNSNFTYFFVDSTMVDTYKAQFASQGGKYSNHVYRYAEHIDNNFYVRVISEANAQIEIVAYTGDIFGTSVTPATLEYLGQTYTVAGIGRDAYINMTNNQSITLHLSVGDGVQYIGNGAFTKLNYITSANTKLATSIGDKAFYNCDYMTTLVVDGQAVIGEEAFANCTRLVNVSLSRCVEIGSKAFSGDKAIVSLSIPNVSIIRSEAFKDCKAFKDVVFGPIVTIDAGTFSGCTSLQTVVLNDATKVIGDECFKGCTALTSIANNSANLSANCLNLNSIEKIGANAFYNCKNIKYIKAPALLEIGEEAFNKCTSLQYIEANAVTKIGNSAFTSLTTLTQISINSVEEIGNSAFKGTGIKYIDIPNATVIGQEAFRNCTSVIEISFGTPTSIGDAAFYNVNPKYIDVSAYTFKADLTIPDNPDVETFAFGGSNKWHHFESDVKYYYKSGKTLPSEIAERKNYIFKTLELSYYTVWNETWNRYTTDERDNISIDYIFEKDKFHGDWIITSEDGYLSKNFYLYNLKISTIVEGETTRYEGEVLSYHGLPLVGYVVIPCQVYYPGGIKKDDFENTESSYYDGIFNIDIDGTVKPVTITKIGYYAYENVDAYGATTGTYSHISFVNTIKTISEGAFRYSKIDFVYLNKIETIEDDGFRNTSDLRYIDLGNVVSIGSYAFSSYYGTTDLWDLYREKGHSFSVTQFTQCLLTKVIFRHVDKIEEGAFYFNYINKSTFMVLDFTQNAPGLDNSYKSGYGPDKRYNIPSDVHQIWRGYNSSLYYYTSANWEAEYNDINIVAPYYENEFTYIQSQFITIIDSQHLFYDYGYTYNPTYKVNEVEVGMFWLKPGNINDPSKGFIITKSLIRNFGEDTSILSVVNASTKRYMYTIPSTLDGGNIYNSKTGKYLTSGQSYPSKISAYSFKNSTVKSGYIVDLTFGDGITVVPSNAFKFAQFKNIYLNDVTTLEDGSFSYSSCSIIYAFNLEEIGASSFVYSSASLIDLRQNKRYNEETSKWETIFVTFNSNFSTNSSISNIYVNDDDLDTYISRTKGTSIFTGSGNIELYAYIKALGTYIGEIKITKDSKYDLESILSTYVQDKNTESIVWSIANDPDNKFSVVEGTVSVNEDEALGNGEKYAEGNCDVYCIKRKTGEADKILGKFRFIIVEENSSVEYYNISKSTIVNKNGNNTDFNGYRIISYYGNANDGTFDPSEEFNDFMTAHITNADRANYQILNYKNPEDGKYTVFELSVGSYMNMKIGNTIKVYLYTNNYITKIGDYAFYSVPLNEIWLSNVKVVGRRAFCNRNSSNSLTTIVMPKVETIEYQAFYQNFSTQIVVVGDNRTSNLKTIASEAFSLCTSINRFGIIDRNLTDPANTELTYYDMKTYINKFNNIPSLDWIKKIYAYTDEHEVTTYSYSYYNKYNTSYGFMYLPDSVTSIGEYAFYQLNQIDEVRYPNVETMTSVGTRVFISMKKLHYVQLGQYVTSIGTEAFANCENLVSTPYPSLTENIMKSFENSIAYGDASYNPHKINSTYSSYRTDGIDFTYIKSIGTGAFRNCYQLDNLYLDSIESIASEAFMECSSLRYISFELNIPREGLNKISFGSRWNYSTHELKRYYVPAAYESKFSDAVYTYVRQKELIAFGDESGYVLNYITNPINTNEILGVKLVCYNGEQLVQIPEYIEIDGLNYSVLTIGKYAYHGLAYTENVKTLILPKNVTTVESHAFDGMLFDRYEEAINLNSSVNYGSYVFNGNTRLKEAVFTRMNSGGAYFFNNCGALTSMDLQNNYVNYVYAAPILDDDFFTGSSTKAKCSIKSDMNYMFTQPAYLGRLFEESEKVDVDNLYAIKLDASNNITILHYIGDDPIGTNGTYTIPTQLQIKDGDGTFYPVTRIADGAFKDADVTTRCSLFIGDNIVYVGNRAFYNTKFGSVEFTGNVRNVEIGDYAFAAMSVITDVDVTKLTSLSAYMFNNDVLLVNVSINLNTTIIPDYCFAECGNIQFFNIGDALLTIGDHAFENCTSLKVIQLNDDTSWDTAYNLGSVTKLGDYAFAGCTNLIRIIAFNVDYIGAYCFKGCSNFYYPNLDNTLSFIGEGAFYQCTKLVTAKAYTTYIPDYCYYGCTSVVTVDVTGARSIGVRAFYQCSGLTGVDLLNLMIVGDYAFYQCTNLETVEMNYVTSIGSYAFYNCAFSGEFTIPAATTIGSYAFANNTQLTKVIFDGSQKFGSRIFNNDVLITEFDFTNNYDNNSVAIQPTSATDVFTGVNDTFFIYVPFEALSAYETAFNNWKHRIFERGRVYSDAPDYMVKDVVDGYEIVRYLGSGLTGTYTVPSTINGKNVVSIGRYAFYNSLKDSTNLKAINLGTNIIDVKKYAFYDFDFETLSMPYVENIGEAAFANNEKLGYLSLPRCKTIGSYAFQNNSSLQLIRFYDTLIRLDYRSFYNCEDLRSVYFANTTNLNSLYIYNSGYEVFGPLTKTDVILRVPTNYVSNYKTKISYYRDRIKAGELDEADFSYRTVTEAGEEVIEIIAYEGQDTSIKIKAVIEGKRVTRILNNAFENSLNLETVYIPDTLKTISSHAFMGNSTIKEVIVYSDNASKLDSTINHVFSDNQIYFASYDGVLFTLDDFSGNRKAASLVYYPVAKTNTSYSFTTSDPTLLDSVNMIYENAFYGNTYLVDLTVPFTVRYIGENAFAYCPSLLYVEFESPQGGSVGCPTLYGTNILTNCNSDLVIIVTNNNYSKLFKNDEYFSYYQDRLRSSR